MCPWKRMADPDPNPNPDPSTETHMDSMERVCKVGSGEGAEEG